MLPKNKDMSLKNAANSFAKSRNDKAKNKPTKEQIQKQTHLAHIAQ